MYVDKIKKEGHLPRAQGALRLSTIGDSEIQELFQQGATKVLFPRHKNRLECIMINTSGGLTGGDEFSNIITLEEGAITGGFGDGVASWLLENNYSGKLKRLGLPDSFIEHGTRKQILSNLGLDAIGLIRTIEETISKIKEFDFK